MTLFSRSHWEQQILRLCQGLFKIGSLNIPGMKGFDSPQQLQPLDRKFLKFINADIMAGRKPVEAQGRFDSGTALGLRPSVWQRGGGGNDVHTWALKIL